MPSPYLAETREWTFRATGSTEERRYEQSELSIDGETSLYALIARTVVKLRKADFDFDALESVMGADEWNIAAIAGMLAQVMEFVPSVAAEGAALLFGIFPLDEDGRRNLAYGDEVKFLRRALHMADVVEILEVFLQQNDQERLRAPFDKAVSLMRNLGNPATAVPTSTDPEATDPLSIVPSTSSSAPDTAPPAKSAGSTRGRRSTAR